MRIESNVNQEKTKNLVVHIDRSSTPPDPNTSFPGGYTPKIRSYDVNMDPDKIDCEYMHPELQNSGPAEFSLDELKSKYYVGSDVVEEPELESCLSLSDLLAMREQIDRNVFEEHFGAFGEIYAWKSVVQDKLGRRWVPIIEVDSFGRSIPASKYQGVGYEEARFGVKWQETNALKPKR
ncbi:MAG: hypothetical protein AAB629_02635 [Patescibacteria group bacterium]